MGTLKNFERKIGKIENIGIGKGWRFEKRHFEEFTLQKFAFEKFAHSRIISSFAFLNFDESQF